MMSQERETQAAILIHSCATASAATSLALANTVVGDAPFLTAITIGMVVALGKTFDQALSISAVAAWLGQIGGFVMGTYLASRLIVWIPGAGNAINATITLGLTELIGWMAYLIFKENRRLSDVTTKEEIETLKARAREMKKKSVAVQKAIEEMPDFQKKEYEHQVEKLNNRNLSDEERQKILETINQLIYPYINQDVN